MNYTELIATLSQKLQLPKTEVSQRVEDTVTVITSELLKNNAVSFGNLGTMEIKKRNERISVNPVSGKRMLIPPKLIVGFKVSSSLKDQLKEMKI
ncbi:MAG: HU family DNA-binding protein [Dysgonamonadaceae bacterium]|jgi:DNA-binding protein HU-beta|nr:HU family DNA-binding protein [Dysgonamonadaceae bacterium]